MARPVSGETKVYQVKIPQKNGSTYVYQRTEAYRDGRMRKVGKDLLLGKILPGDPDQKMVPTRPKKKIPSVSSTTDSGTVRNLAKKADAGIQATRIHIGSQEILKAVGKKHGIDEDIYSLLDEGTAQKLISCSRFLVSTDGECLSHIETWQITHPIPYAEGLSKDICHRLTEDLGENESFRMGFFAKRINRQPGDVLVVAYDGSTVSTYSENQIDARYGFNKANDGLKTIKILALYASEVREPLGFNKQPGNLPDVISVRNAIAELSVLTTRRLILVADNGFYSEANAYDMIHDSFSFLMRIEINTAWVRCYLDRNLKAVTESSCGCSDDAIVVGITKAINHTFVKVDEQGNKHSVTKRVYLHFYCDHKKRTCKNAELRIELNEIINLLEKGVSVDCLSNDAQKLVKKHIRFKTVRKKEVPYIDDASVKKACQYNGIFSIIGYGNYPEVRETRKAFKTYINREHIEDHFRAEKQSVDGNHVRSWYGTNYMGRLTIQFVALLYEDCLLNDIKEIMTNLEKDIAESKTSGKGKTLAAKKENLLKWLKKQSLYSLLSWFDAIEETTVSSQIRSKRWNTETTERDRMFLELIGVDSLNT